MTAKETSGDLPEEIEFNEKFEESLEAMEERETDLFVTGRAGTGKSTLLSYFCQNTEKNVAFVAPTGVAAVNIKGETIHSFFQFSSDITVEKVKGEYDGRDRDGLFQELDAIVIDEISMVRADLLDCINTFLHMNGPREGEPFGGIQMILIGDLYQLPPVVTGQDREWFHPDTEEGYESPYFFESESYQHAEFRMIQLEKVYRQTDDLFLELLNGIRSRSISDEQLEILNERVQPEFEPGEEEFYVYITTTNRRAGEINRERLATLEGPERTFGGEVRGEFPETALPTDTELRLREGAQVMLVNNDS